MVTCSQVGILGARYGWTPLVKEGEISPDSYKAWEPLVSSYVSKFVAKTSITELEFLYGILLRPLPNKAMPNRVSHGFVYLRADEYYEKMDVETRKRFYDGDDKKAEKLLALKNRIKAQPLAVSGNKLGMMRRPAIEVVHEYPSPEEFIVIAPLSTTPHH